MPPNCVIEVDDVLDERTWREQFDLIHLRNMLGSFDPREWDLVYTQCCERVCFTKKRTGSASGHKREKLPLVGGLKK
jgi:hypothetical protein